jgi:hypothetical protein
LPPNYRTNPKKWGAFLVEIHRDPVAAFRRPAIPSFAVYNGDWHRENTS